MHLLAPRNLPFFIAWTWPPCSPTQVSVLNRVGFHTKTDCEKIKGKTEIINTSARYWPTPLPALGALVRGCLSESTDGRIFQTTMSPQTFQTISRAMRQTSKSWQNSSHQGRLGKMAAVPALVVAPFCGNYPFMPSMHDKYDTKTQIKKYPKNSLECWMLKASIHKSTWENLRRPLTTTWRLEKWTLKERFWGAQTAQGARRPRSCILGQTARAGPAQVGMKGRHIVPLLIISLREKHSKCLTSPNICI